MSDAATTRTISEVHVNVAEFAVARDGGVLATVGLGSCVAIMLWDPATRLAAMAHILLPHEALSRERERPAKFSTTAVPLLVGAMREHGAAGPFEAKLVGGASMFGALLGTGGVNMGERNVVSARRALSAAGIPVVAEEVGGDYGRTVYFDSSNGAVRVTSIRHAERVL